MVFIAGCGYGLPFIIDHISYVVRDGPRRCLGFRFLYFFFFLSVFIFFLRRLMLAPTCLALLGTHTHKYSALIVHAYPHVGYNLHGCLVFQSL